MSPTERREAAEQLVRFLAESLVLSRPYDDMMDAFLEKLEAMCARCRSLRAEPTADFRECKCEGACPGTEWRTQGAPSS